MEKLTHQIAMSVSPDEPCLWLWELPMVGRVPGQEGTAWRLIQRISVIRNDAPAEHRRDLGPIKAFNCDPIFIPGGSITYKNGYCTPIPENIPFDQISRIDTEHTVGELMEWADWQREQSRRSSQVEPTDLWGQWAQQLEQIKTAMKRNHRTMAEPMREAKKARMTNERAIMERLGLVL